MGIREEIEKDIGDKNVTRIVGQPSERDVTQLRKELGKMGQDPSKRNSAEENMATLDS